MKTKIAVITGGVLPVPDVRGGAVESLLNSFLENNENERYFDLTIFSIFDKVALEKSKNSPTTKFVFVDGNIFTRFFDSITFFFVFRILRLKKANLFQNLFKRLHFLRKVKKDLKNDNFDMVVIENSFLSYFCFMSRTNREKYTNRIIFHCHNLPKHYQMFSREIAITNTIVSVSEAVNQRNKALFSKFPGISFQVLRNGVDPRYFHKISEAWIIENIRSQYHIPSGVKVVLFAGRFSSEKGIFQVIDSLALLSSNYFLVLAGGVFYGSRAQSTETRLLERALSKIRGRYLITGFIPHKNMCDLYNAADVVVLPSISFESASLAVIEALMCGSPLITTKTGGTAEYATSESAIVLPVNQNLSSSLAASIALLCTNVNAKNEMTKRALLLSANYSIDAYCLNYQKILRNAFAKLEVS